VNGLKKGIPLTTTLLQQRAVAAGNESMRAAGRVEWSVADWLAACKAKNAVIRNAVERSELRRRSYE
jgi:hypothetical protein